MKSLLAAFVLLSFTLAGCSSAPEIKQQSFAKLSNERTFENDFVMVWKGIEDAVRNYKVLERDPKSVDPLELGKLTERSLKTDWIYGRSNDKYQEYKVNGLPRKVFLQNRMQYEIEAKTVMGGTHVEVEVKEELESLKKDGTSRGFSSVEATDPAKAAELLEKIQLSILSAP